MEFKIAIRTDVGIKKETNQDSCCVLEAKTEKGNILMAVICDGMGGLAKGEVASATLIRTFAGWFERDLPQLLSMQAGLPEIQYQWDRIIKEQNQNIAAYGKTLKLQLGTTITALLILENGSYLIGHVGDSRAYCVTDQALQALTEDQTVVAREIKLGRMTPEEAERDPRRNVLLQCVGASRVVQPEFYYGTVGAGQCLLLCSDGFRHVVSGAEIQQAFAPGSNPDESTMAANVERLIDLNKFRHETDNITAVLIKVIQGV